MGKVEQLETKILNRDLHDATISRVLFNDSYTNASTVPRFITYSFATVQRA